MVNKSVAKERTTNERRIERATKAVLIAWGAISTQYYFAFFNDVFLTHLSFYVAQVFTVFLLFHLYKTGRISRFLLAFITPLSLAVLHITATVIIGYDTLFYWIFMCFALLCLSFLEKKALR